MRLSVLLTPQKDTPQPIPYHHIQSSLYALVRNTGIPMLHNEHGYKYFCFSNLFPFKRGQPFVKGVSISFLLSSPSADFIDRLNRQLLKVKSLQFGQFFFDIINTRIVTSNVRHELTFQAGTPIVASIPRALYKEYGVESDRPYLYWYDKLPLNIFIDLVSRNLIRKYNSFYQEHLPEDLSLFRNMKYNGFAVIPYKQGKITATYWKFQLQAASKEQLNLYKFALDCGLGEKNSAGFGFVNVKS